MLSFDVPPNPGCAVPLFLSLDSPCAEDWSAMTGEGAVRHCARCDKDVHDLSALPRASVDAVLANPAGACVRFTRRSDGSVRLAAAAMLASGLAACAPHPAGIPTGEQGDLAGTTVTIDVTSPPPAGMCTPGKPRPLVGTAAGTMRIEVTDDGGLSVPGAVVTLTPEDGSAPVQRITDDDGLLVFEGLAPGSYRWTAVRMNFSKAFGTVRLAKDTAIAIGLEIGLEYGSEWMGALVYTPTITPGTVPTSTTYSRDRLDRIP